MTVKLLTVKLGSVDGATMSEADWWSALHGASARWRQSRTLQWCANQRLGGADPAHCEAGPAVQAIEPGDAYFDTGEVVEPPWRTLHLCARCANRRTR